MLHRIEIDGSKQLSEPEPYTGCSTSKEGKSNVVMEYQEYATRDLF
jgi:hypothetical protein